MGGRPGGDALMVLATRPRRFLSPSAARSAVPLLLSALFERARELYREGSTRTTATPWSRPIISPWTCARWVSWVSTSSAASWKGGSNLNTGHDLLLPHLVLTADLLAAVGSSRPNAITGREEVSGVRNPRDDEAEVPPDTRSGRLRQGRATWA